MVDEKVADLTCVPQWSVTCFHSLDLIDGQFLAFHVLGRMTRPDLAEAVTCLVLLAIGLSRLLFVLRSYQVHHFIRAATPELGQACFCFYILDLFCICSLRHHFQTTDLLAALGAQAHYNNTSTATGRAQWLWHSCSRT